MSVRQSLLAILAQGPCYGYQLRSEFERRTGSSSALNVGQIYSTLERLERDGLVLRGTADADGHIYWQITDAGRAEVASRAGDLRSIEEGLADSVRLIADEVRGSVREAMKSLRADLAAASRAERQDRSEQVRDVTDDLRSISREQLHRAEVAISEFRAQVRTDLRTHVAKGGTLTASVVDELATGLDEVTRAITRSLRG